MLGYECRSLCGLRFIGDSRVCGRRGEKALLPSCRAYASALTEHCNFEPDSDGILQMSTAAYGRKEDMHASIIYGDYFYTEAVLRFLNKSFLIW